MKKPKALVLTGDGINCEVETAQAFELVGFESQIRHLNDLISDRLTMDQLSLRYSVIAIPGGFSFGDDLGSGKVLAIKMQKGLGWDLNTFVGRGGLVLGVCNGFQALIKMGVFSKDLSITQNNHGRFINTWVKLNPIGSKCVWLKGVGALDLPIRHGEGRLVISTSRHKEVVARLERHGMACLKYESDPNGSEMQIAGLCDPSGRIFGLMPHPEAFVRWNAHPDWTGAAAGSASASQGRGQGLALFENAYKEATRGS